MYSFLPSEGEFEEKLWIFFKVKNVQNPFCVRLEIINLNYYKKYFFVYHDYQSYVLLCSKMTSFPPSEGVSKITFGSI